VALALSTLKKNGKAESVKTGAVLFLPVILFFASGTNNTLINYTSSTFYQPSESSLFTAIACTGAILIGNGYLLIRVLLFGEKVQWQSVVGGLILGFPNFLSFYFLLGALSDFGNSAAFVFPIYNVLSMLTSAFMAWILFKETLEPLNKVGLALAVAAIFLISYQEIMSVF